MAELLLDINDQILADIQSLRGVHVEPELLLQEALALLMWSYTAIEKGYQIGAVAHDQRLMERVILAHEKTEFDNPMKRRARFRVVVPGE